MLAPGLKHGFSTPKKPLCPALDRADVIVVCPNKLRTAEYLLMLMPYNGARQKVVVGKDLIFLDSLAQILR